MPSMDRTCSCTSRRFLSDRDLGNLGIGSMPLALRHVPWIIPDQLCGRAHCPSKGGHYHWGSAMTMLLIWFTLMFGCLMCVKQYSHECQDPRFPRRTLHCNKMFDVAHLTCQWLNVVADRCIRIYAVHTCNQCKQASCSHGNNCITW